MTTPQRLAVLCVLSSIAATTHAGDTDLRQQLAQLKQQIAAIEARLNAEDSQVTSKSKQEISTASQERIDTIIDETAEQPPVLVKVETPKNDGIKFGGAIRTNYSYTSYNEGNKNRNGDFDFDIFRLNLSGDVDDILLGAEIRFFDYMTAVKYAWVGYEFIPDWQIKAGITPVQFGNKAYNSHNYFFSTNYYLGLEDDYDLGVLLSRQIKDNWQLDLGFYKNDELGGVDGYVDDRTDRYSYDVIGLRNLSDGIYDETSQPVGEYNTTAGRVAYHMQHGAVKTEVGLSGLTGGLHDGTRRVGDYDAWAAHLNSSYDRWNFQLQHSQYQYDVDGIDRMAVGAYGFYDSIAAKAKSTTANIAYNLPVRLGPITDLQFYNNYGLVYDKSDKTADTLMNVTGVSVSAGKFFSYIDWVNARNQPFVGGSASGDSHNTEQRFNINLGYYF